MFLKAFSFRKRLGLLKCILSSQQFLGAMSLILMMWTPNNPPFGVKYINKVYYGLLSRACGTTVSSCSSSESFIQQSLRQRTSNSSDGQRRCKSTSITTQSSQDGLLGRFVFNQTLHEYYTSP